MYYKLHIYCDKKFYKKLITKHKKQNSDSQENLHLNFLIESQL